MRADDEHDPLDRWLNQQVQPLPPPPGTFELITRRARGRKLRKLAVTVVSAAAVAAAVAIAVPVGLNLHLTPAPVNGRSVADGTSTHPRDRLARRERDPHQDAEPVAAPRPQPATSHPAGPVPAQLPAVLGHVRERRITAWVIGQAGTPGHVRQQDSDICTSIARTDDGGPDLAGRARAGHRRARAGRPG